MVYRTIKLAEYTPTCPCREHECKLYSTRVELTLRYVRVGKTYVDVSHGRYIASVAASAVKHAKRSNQ